MSFLRFTALPLLLAIAFVCARPGPVAAHELAPERLAQNDAVFRGSQAETLAGIVHAVVVDDPLRGTSIRYVELALDDGTLVPLRGDASDAMAAGTRAKITGRRNGKTLDVDAIETVAAPAATPKANTQIDGTFAILHADDFVHGTSSFVYELHPSTGKAKRLRLGSATGLLAPGMRIRVSGRAEADGESITPLQITVLAEPTGASEPAGAVAKAATTNSVLVILANFSNTAVPGYTAAQAQQVMTSNSDSVANFFREASYGEQLMNVTVTPSWVTMNLARPASCSTTNWQNIGAAAEAAAKALGASYDPASYQFVVYLFPTVPSCGWLGLAYIGNPHKAWINGPSAFVTQAVAHEMGHNFGLLHAASLSCAGASIGGSCSASEYGDPFDTMGNQRAMHYNATQKARLGWIAATGVQTYAGGSATYTLTPLEMAGGTTYAVKIPTSSTNRTYWIEFRQPIGFDSPLAAFPNNGAQIRVASPFEIYCPGCDAYSDDTELIDATPSTAAFTDATLVAGNTFRDPTYGINVTVVSASASAMTVQVSSGTAPPVQSPTTTTVAASANPALVGVSVTFTASVSGSAPTGTVQFTADGTTLAGCAGVTLSGGRAACSTSSLVAGTHAIVARYSGNSTNAASTSAALSEVVNAASGASIDVALAANGGVASASSTLRPANAVQYVNDGRRSGAGWSTGGGGWADATRGAFPDWVQVNFNGQKTLDHVVVYSVQDNFQNPVEPTDTTTFTFYGLTAFAVQGWNGTSWATLGSVSGNNLVKRTVSFPAYTTDRIRVVVTGVADGTYSRITEVEAWTATSAATTANYALAANGGVASASSTLRPANAVQYVNDGQRSGAGWSTGGGGWADATPGAFPDWVQIAFNAQKTIDHVVVYSVQDDFQSPVEPTDTTTFKRYGLTAFQVQGWNGSAWVTLASVAGNNLVKRTVSFPAYKTDHIRVLVTGVADGTYSRITEVEAWGS